MSNEIATLGLAINSQPVVQASAALDKFQKSANAAAQGADKLAAAAKPAASAAAAVQKVVETADKAMANVTKSTGLARHEMINLSRQLQDVGVSLASGQSPFMVLAQQGTQIADIFGSSKTGTVGGALKQIGGGIASVLTPLRLLGLGFAGLAVGGVYAVGELAKSAKAFDDVARSVNATTGEIHSLQQAASFKGIGQDDFFKGIQQFGGAVYDAQHNMGSLAEVFRANNTSAKTFTGYLEKAADLIKNASSDQARLQLLQQMGLPATMDWVRFLSQGKDGIRAATEEAAKFNESAEGQLVASARKFDEAWAKATGNLANNFKSALLNALNGLDNFTFSAIDKMRELSRNTYAPSGAAASSPGQALIPGSQGLKRSDYEWGGPKPTVDKNDLQNRISKMQPPLGLFGQTPTAKQASKPTPEKEEEHDRDRDRRAA